MVSVVWFIRRLGDTTGVGIPDIPNKYRGKLGRNVIEASWNPYHLLKRGSYLTWTTLMVFLGLILLAVTIIGIVVKRVRRC